MQQVRGALAECMHDPVVTVIAVSQQLPSCGTPWQLGSWIEKCRAPPQPLQRSSAGAFSTTTGIVMQPGSSALALCLCWLLVQCFGAICRAYHEKCLDPPVVLADIPEDEGWLCPACDAKVCAVLCVLGSRSNALKPWFAPMHTPACGTVVDATKGQHTPQHSIARAV
jgi:hypothetical protein